MGPELRWGEEGIDDVEEEEGVSVGRGEEREGNSRNRERRISATAKAIIGARKLMGFDGIMGRFIRDERLHIFLMGVERGRCGVGSRELGQLGMRDGAVRPKICWERRGQVEDGAGRSMGSFSPAMGGNLTASSTFIFLWFELRASQVAEGGWG